MPDEVVELSKGRIFWNDLLHALPVIIILFALVSTISVVMGESWVNGLIKTDRENQPVVFDPQLQALLLQVSSAKQTAETNETSIERVETKIDRLLLILTENRRQ